MMYRTFAGLFALAALVLGASPASAQLLSSAGRTNAKICGTLLDFTQNSCCDRRIYSQALCQYRDLYVYLPPDYDPKGCYPLLVWLHSYTDDECEFRRKVLPVIDRAIACGDLPPMVVVAPDGSIEGNHHFIALGSWYVNSRRGRFADFIMEDVLKFVDENFAVCHDRAGRAIAGYSMGGFGAFNLGLKHSDQFKVVAGISPALNMRYSSRERGYLGNFVPDLAILREEFSGNELVGSFYDGFLKIRAWMVIRPVFGRGREAVERVSADNPIELLDRLNVQPGHQDYYVGYGKADDLNINAQVESFVHVANQRGIHVETKGYPSGDHSIVFMVSALPDFFVWVKEHLSCAGCNEPKQSISATSPQETATGVYQDNASRSDAVLVLPQAAPLGKSSSQAAKPSRKVSG